MTNNVAAETLTSLWWKINPFTYTSLSGQQPPRKHQYIFEYRYEMLANDKESYSAQMYVLHHCGPTTLHKGSLPLICATKNM